MRRWIGWLLTFAACGPITAQPSSHPPTAADCDAAARGSLSFGAWGGVSSTEIDNATEALSTRCMTDHWPIGATRCFGAARNKSDAEDCVPMLTREQREAAANAVAGH
ncbi:MAG: hypothetical protein H0T46_02750 [Deltaproteobacteria bacterium]|nr:hypothetical protein [Deltaproteobacteria bacterium]